MFLDAWLRLALRMINTENDKETWAKLGKVCLYSQMFKPITAARRQVRMEKMRVVN